MEIQEFARLSLRPSERVVGMTQFPGRTHSGDIILATNEGRLYRVTSEGDVYPIPFEHRDAG